MELRFEHWLYALLLASLVHAGVLLWLSEQKTGAVAAGVGGIEISLGPAGGAPGAVSSVAAEEVEATSELSNAAEAPAVDIVETTSLPNNLQDALPTDVTDVVEAVANQPNIIPTPISAPSEPETVQAEVDNIIRDVQASTDAVEITPQLLTSTTTTVVASTVPEPQAVPAKELKPKKPKAKPKPKKPRKKKTDTKAKQTKKKSKPKPQKKARKSAPGSGGKSGDQMKKDAGSDKARAAGGNPAAKRNYYGKLAAWLNKHKRYPRRARQRRQQGTVKARFVINRQGQVLSHQIVGSSGHKLLDREVKAMLKRASPMPPIPADFKQSRLTITVPIAFSLR